MQLKVQIVRYADDNFSRLRFGCQTPVSMSYREVRYFGK